MPHTVAVTNQKGGVGKTTLTMNLGAAFAHKGARVLMIDFDPQGHLTTGIGKRDIYDTREGTFFQVLTGKDLAAINSVIRTHEGEGFDFIPANADLFLLERELDRSRNREYKLRNLLEMIVAPYDWILIDCPPDLGALTDNAINAARNVIVPVQAEGTSTWALELLLDQVETIERELRIQVEILAIIPNLVQTSTMGREILAELRRDVPGVAPFEMPKRVILGEAWRAGGTIYAYRPQSREKRIEKQQVMEMYDRLADYVLARIEEVSYVGR
jgi:chromosome partitioning protein